jgi:surface antigen
MPAVTFRMTALALVAATALSACSSDPNAANQNAGAVAGAVTGGLLGAALGGRGGGRIAGAAIGAVAGGLIGSAIGAQLDERDRQLAYEAEMRALESGPPGAPVGWRGESSGYYGNVVPGPYYESRGMRCRQYTHTVYINGRPQSARGTACRNPDGTWQAVS